MQDPNHSPQQQVDRLNFGRTSTTVDASVDELDKLKTLADMLRERAAALDHLAEGHTEAVKQRIWDQISQHIESKTGKRV